MKEKLPERLPPEVEEALKCYVYIYIDPRNQELFYIGKGTGNRLLSHLTDDTESEKARRIAEIRKAGHEPKIDILRYGLSDSEAALVEAAAIDLIGKDNLTNQNSGFHEESSPRVTLKDLLVEKTAKPVEVLHKAVLITINKLFRSGMSDLELYEATRGIWHIAEDREKAEKAEVAMAVYHGIVREVYTIQRWLPAGTLEYETRDSTDFKNSGRWEFEGTVAKDIREKDVGHFVGKGGQNPIRYENIK